MEPKDFIEKEKILLFSLRIQKKLQKEKERNREIIKTN